ncbi:MAG: TPM domain-containing protein [Verrucomicrobia bacterium]|nr:MAG: TPM domain-containing protein [Verrucomicrobiota bacterium]
MARLTLFLALLIWSFIPLQGAEGLPPSPKNYFNDEASMVSPQVAMELNTQLERFDQQTSNQIVVVIEPTFSSRTSLDDYAQQLYSTWHLGTKKNSNGVLLLIFAKEHQIHIQTGYGLEGALPDALCKQIIDEVMTPLFQQGNPNQALLDGIHAIMKATAGEYKNENPLKKKQIVSWQRLLFSPIGFFLLIIIISFFQKRSSGGKNGGGGGWFIGGGGLGGGTGGGNDWGGFSGGGGESGGGGADGSW